MRSEMVIAVVCINHHYNRKQVHEHSHNPRHVVNQKRISNKHYGDTYEQ